MERTDDLEVVHVTGEASFRALVRARARFIIPVTVVYLGIYPGAHRGRGLRARRLDRADARGGEPRLRPDLRIYLMAWIIAVV